MRKFMNLVGPALVLIVGVAMAQTPPTPLVTKAKPGTYAHVQAIFDARCIGCHGERARGQIDLRKYESVMKGGEDGVIVKAKNLKKSVLYQAVIGAEGYRAMPPRSGKLPDKEIKSIETWIKNGAKRK